MAQTSLKSQEARINMKTKTAIFFTLLSFALTYTVDARTVTFDSDQTIQSAPDPEDITVSGKWLLRSSDNLFEKTIDAGKFKLYPDQADRTQAVIDAQADAFDEIDIYIKEGIQAGFVTVIGDGLDLDAVASITYDSACIDNGSFCSFFVRQNNQQYVLTVFADENDETAAATTARTNALAELATVANAADAGSFWERR
jgi:hypothetical protein